MSNVVDDRVVKMKFDNEQFEDGVKDTMRSLDDLDKNLKNFEGRSFGGNLENALNGIGGAVDDLSERFDAWGVFAKRIIENVADAAYQQGIKMVKSLSTDNIMAGWEKYEDLSSNIYAITNQVSNGESYEDVTRAIEKLSWYSDATSFSLSDMTSALKGFVSQGIDLDTATAMIMGMGNSITYAGAGAKEGSGAFQVFAKAMGQGYIGLRQWQQMSSTYGIGTYGLKKQALDAAVALNKLTVSYDEAGEAIYETEEGLTFTIDEFDTTLGNQKGKWLDKEVMQAIYGDTGAYGEYIAGLSEYIQLVKETEGRQLTWNEAVEEYGEYLGRDLTEQEEFGKVAADSATVAKTLTEAIDAVKDAVSSSWQRIFQSMFGDVEKAKQVWSDFSEYLNEIFGSPMAQLANYMEAWAKLPLELGGRDSFLNIFRNLSQAVRSYLNPITKAWEVIHGSKTFDEIVSKIGETVKKVEEFTAKLKLGVETSEKFQRIWEVIFEVLKTAHEGLKKIWGLFKAAGSIVTPVIKLLGGVAYAIAEIVDVIFKVFNMDGNLWGWLNGPTAALNKLGSKLNDIVSIFSISKDTIEEGGTRAMTGMGDAAEYASEKVEGTTVKIRGLWDVISSSEAYAKFKENLDEAKARLEEWNSSFLDKFSEAYGQNGKGLWGVVVAAYRGIRDGLSAFYDSMLIMLDGHFSGAMEKVKKFAGLVETAVGAIAHTVTDLAKKAYNSISGGSLFDNLLGGSDEVEEKVEAPMSALDRFRQRIQADANSTLFSSKLMSRAYQILSTAFNLSMFNNINKIMKNISGMFDSAKGMLGSASKTLDQLTSSLKTMQTSVKADIIKTIATAVVALAGAMFILAMIPQEELSNALGVMTVLMMEMGAFVAFVSKMDLQKSVTSLNGDKKRLSFVSSGVNDMAKEIIAISAGMILLSTALAKISAIPEDQLKRGFAAMTGIMIELAAFNKFASTKDGVVGGLQGSSGMNIFKMASGLVVMAQAMKMLADLDDENNSLGKGLGAVGGILTMLFTFQAAMSKWASGGIGDMSNLIALSAGLAALAIVIKGFAAIPTEDLIKGGVSVAACLTAIGVFMVAMTKSKVSASEMLKLSAALVVFGAALGVISGALILMNMAQWESLGKAALIIGGFAAAAILLAPASSALLAFGVAVAAFGVGIAGVGVGLLAFATAMTMVGMEAPLFAQGIIETLRTLLLGIVSLKTEFTGAILAIIMAICDAIAGSVDVIVQTIGVVLLAVLQGLLEFFVQLLDLFDKYWPVIKEKGGVLFKAIWEALKLVVPKILLDFIGFLGKIGKYILDHRGEIKDKAIQLLKMMGAGVLKGADYVLSKFGDLLVGMVEAVKKKYKEMKARAGELINNFKHGIEEKWDSIKTTASEMIGNFLQGIRDKFDSLLTIGSDVFAKIKEGLVNAFEAPLTGIKNIGINLINGLKNGLNDPGANGGLLGTIGGITKGILGKLQTGLQEQSPSKATETMGRYLMEGFVVGIDGASFSAEEEARMAADNILLAFGDPLQDMIDKLEAEVDMNPTITPVIDLSQFSIGVEGMQKGFETVQDMVDTAKRDYSNQNYWNWYKKYVSGEYEMDAEHAVMSFHSDHINGNKQTVTYGKNQMDMVNAAASGFLNAESSKFWKEHATEADMKKAMTLYQINQNITSPTPADKLEIYNAITTGVKDITAKAAAKSKSISTYLPSNSTAKVVLNS